VPADPLEPLRADPAGTALIFDVDGTLAPIVARPELAQVPEATRVLLADLVRRYALVAFVSGRTGDDARRMVGLDGARYVGNHGLELHPLASGFPDAIAAFRDAAGRDVEDKGLTLSYHYRDAADEEAARADLEALATEARRRGLVARWGRKVLEIRPPVAADKGSAVEALVREAAARNALYAGDDTTDLDAFTRLAGAGLDHVVRVAVASDEGPRELAAAAEIVVESPEELAAILARL
jgi:trehalose 6-phosphate phosphatase